MARKTSAAKAKSDKSTTAAAEAIAPVRPPNEWAEAMRQACVVASQKTGNTGVFVSDNADRIAIGIPFPSFAQEWFYHNTGFVLGRVNLSVGESGSCKSAFLFEQMRHHLTVPNSAVKYNFTEARDTPTLRKSIIGEHLIDGVIGPINCPSIEAWQDETTNVLKWLRDDYGKTKGPSSITFIGVDSMSGVTSQSTIDKIWEDGHASLQHPIDSNKINTYLKFLPSAVHDWPMSFVATNHVKFNIIPMPGGRTRREARIPGGDALKFHATTILEFHNEGPIKREDCSGGNRITLRMLKNSLGEKGKELQVDMLWWYIPTGAKGEDGREIKKQHTIFDWHTATCKLLAEHHASGKSEVGDVCAVEYSPSGRTAKCPKLGIKSWKPASEVGRLIAEDYSLMQRLRDFYGIHPVTPYRPGVPWKTQLEDAEKAGHLRTVAEGAAVEEDEADTIQNDTSS